jgi:hypothetical protein
MPDAYGAIVKGTIGMAQFGPVRVPAMGWESVSQLVMPVAAS